jgi:hypothetical protein
MGKAYTHTFHVPAVPPTPGDDPEAALSATLAMLRRLPAPHEMPPITFQVVRSVEFIRDPTLYNWSRWKRFKMRIWYFFHPLKSSDFVLGEMSQSYGDDGVGTFTFRLDPPSK